MTAEDVWNIWFVLSSYINKKDRAQAIEELLKGIYENDYEEDFNYNQLRDIAEYEEDVQFAKITKRFIKENEIYEEEEDY